MQLFLSRNTDGPSYLLTVYTEVKTLPKHSAKHILLGILKEYLVRSVRLRIINKNILGKESLKIHH